MLKTFVNTQIALKKLRDDVEGASLIEYSLLIGLISAAVVTAIVAIAPKIADYWADLNSVMPDVD